MNYFYVYLFALRVSKQDRVLSKCSPYDFAFLAICEVFLGRSLFSASRRDNPDRHPSTGTCIAWP